MNATIRFATLVGRILIVMLFVLAGFNKIMDFQGTTDYMSQMGMPAVAFFAVAALIVEIVGGLSVIIGWFARWGALILLLFLLVVTPIFHAFWTHSDPQMFEMQMQHFFKNLAIIGGLLYIIAYGPGPISVDARRRGGRA